MTCAWIDDDERGQCGKREYKTSKYCFEHKAKAHKIWVDRNKEQAEERQKQRDKFAAIQKEAIEAGMEAGKNCIPEPMIVFDNITGEMGKVDSGGKGMAWIVHRNGRDKFSYWGRKYGNWKKHHYGGIQYWCFEFKQSLEKKQAFCRAFAKVLNNNGINAMAQSRED